MFSLYDATKAMTDPHRRKRQLAQQLFEWAVPKKMKVGAMKKEVVAAMNRLFPLYRGRYTVAEAVKVLQREEEQLRAVEEAVARGDDDELASNLKNLAVDESLTTTQSVDEVAATEKGDGGVGAGVAVEAEADPKRLNVFGIEHVRLRKQRGGRVLEMLFDDKPLSTQIVGRKDTVQLIVERVPMEEHFTKNHLCFFLQRYTPNQVSTERHELTLCHDQHAKFEVFVLFQRCWTEHGVCSWSVFRASNGMGAYSKRKSL